jgi:hypothetical protein
MAVIDEKISDGRENWTEEEWRNYNEFVADAITKEEEEVIEDMIEADNDY